MKKIILLILGIVLLFTNIVSASNGDVYYFTNTPIELINSQLILFLQIIIWFFFIIIAETKEDTVYFIVCSVLALTTGFNLLTIPNLHALIGTTVMLTAIYFSFLAWACSDNIRNRFKGEHENE